MSTHEIIRSQLHRPLKLEKGGMYVLRNGERTKYPLRPIGEDNKLRWHQDDWAYSDDGRIYPDGEESEFDIVAEVIVIEHAGGVAVLTPSQGRQVLAGGELVVKEGKVVVK